jgi:hypothetical protein
VTLHYGATGAVLSVGGRPVGPLWTRQAARVVGPSAHMRAVTQLPKRQAFDWEAVVSGCATVYNKVLPDDRGGKELFMPRAFRDDDGVEIPLLLDHDADEHAGWVVLRERSDGLYFDRGQLRRGVLRKIGNARAVSLAFTTVASLQLRGVTRRYKCRAVELSVCAQGCHSPYATISIVGPATLAAAA